MGAHRRGRIVRGRRWLVAAVIGVVIALTFTGAAQAARLYVAVGDSVGAGMGATPGHSYFDLYCAYLRAAGRVDECVNQSTPGMTSQSALQDGAIGNVVHDIDTSTDTPVVTVILGGDDLLGPGCQPITASACGFDHNMGTILGELETALAGHPGPHYIQWLEYYNPDHDNPYGNASQDTATAQLLLGGDLSYSDCSSADLGLFGLDDEINCIATHYGATPVDAYAPFQANCAPPTNCFSDALHPNDTGYGLIFDAFRDNPGTPVPAPATITSVSESRRVFAPSTRHRRRGVTFSFELSAAAPVTVRITRQSPGRRVGSRCLAASPARRHHPRCTRSARVTAWTEPGHPGHNAIFFGGDVHGEPLRPGRYHASFAVGGGAPAPGRTLEFHVVTP